MGYQPKVYMNQGGDEQTIASGGKQSVQSGGEVNLETGSTINVNSVDKTPQLTNAIQGAAVGYKIARGVVTPTSASHTVVTGLATVVAAIAQLNGAPTMTHMFTEADIGDQAGTPAAGSILVLSQKPTASGNVTPIASSTPWGEVGWIAIGT